MVLDAKVVLSRKEKSLHFEKLLARNRNAHYGYILSYYKIIFSLKNNPFATKNSESFEK